jgi:hypothetical protein
MGVDCLLPAALLKADEEVNASLPGRYDIDLSFVPERPQPGVELAPRADEQSVAVHSCPRATRAALLSQQQPLEVLVVEHVEQPTAD